MSIDRKFDDADRQMALLRAEVFSRLCGAVRLPRAPSIDAHLRDLRGTSRTRRNVDPKTHASLVRMEKLSHSPSLRAFMTERVRELLYTRCDPMKLDDIHAHATADLAPRATTPAAQAYLTNAVAWGLATLVRKREIEKLDRGGHVMRHPSGQIMRGQASYYVASATGSLDDGER